MELILFLQTFPFVEETMSFIDAGGKIVVPIIFLSLLMWTLIVERFFYLFIYTTRTRERLFINNIFGFPNSRNTSTKVEIKHYLTVRKRSLSKNMALIKQCVAIAPLLGLLGTVTGMIEVFEVLKQFGSSNNILIAQGFSHATVPTMLGLAVAICGFFMVVFLETTITSRIQDLGTAITGIKK